TVTEIAAVGAAAVYVPSPSAVDDHQTLNARFLVDAGAGWLLPQREMCAEVLSKMLQNMQRSTPLERAEQAKKMQKIEATAAVVRACEELAACNTPSTTSISSASAARACAALPKC